MGLEIFWFQESEMMYIQGLGNYCGIDAAFPLVSELLYVTYNSYPAFVRANFPQSNTRITIQNLQGKASEVACIYNGIRYCFSAGWKSFACGNKLKEGDVCIFELIDTDKMRIKLNIHLILKDYT